MAYNPYQFYQPMYQGVPDMRQYQYMPQQQSSQPAQQPQNAQPGRIWVPNEKAAMEYLVAPNSAVDLWDMNTPVVYLKQADASGKPTIRAFDLVERVEGAPAVHEPKYVAKSELDAITARVKTLEETITELSGKRKTAPKEKEESE